MYADPKLRLADLQACCSCLGFREGLEYKIDPDANASLLGILRYLRNETADCDIRRELGQLRIVGSDLVPLLKVAADSGQGQRRSTVELVIRLLMNLTQPALVCFRQQYPKDRDLASAFHQIDRGLLIYKKEFADRDLFTILHDLVREQLDKSWEDRSEDDRLLVERILILVRNILHIAPDINEEKVSDEDAGIHDRLLKVMNQSGWFDLLLYLGNAADAQPFTFHTMELVSLMLRDKTAEQIAAANRDPALMTSQPVSDDRTKLIDRFWQKENVEKRQFLYNTSWRHNRFHGTYELLDTKSMSNKPIIYHHDILSSALTKSSSLCGHSANDSIDRRDDPSLSTSIDFGLDKRKFRRPKNRKPLIDRPLHYRSEPEVEKFLHTFCTSFLRLCYNPLMASAYSSLNRQAGQANDETYYMWFFRFFGSFSRASPTGFYSTYISQTMSLPIFHWLHEQVMRYRELLMADKRGGSTNPKALQAARRLSMAISTLHEYFECLARMLNPTAGDKLPSSELGESESSEERLRSTANAADIILANILYISEYQELLPLLLREFNEILQSRECLRGLVECSYRFLHLLNNRLKTGRSLFMNKHQARRSRTSKHNPGRPTDRRRRSESPSSDDDDPEEDRIRLEHQWSSRLCSDLCQALTNLQSSDDLESGDLDLDLALFDPVSVDSEQEQITTLVKRIQSTLFAGNVKTGLSLATRMWQLWPELSPLNRQASVNDDGDLELINNDIESQILSEDDRDKAVGLTPSNVTILGAMRKILFTQFEDDRGSKRQSRDDLDDDDNQQEQAIREEMGVDDEDDPDVASSIEVELDLGSLLIKFAHPQAIHSYTLLLSDYATNPPSTNNCLVRLLHKLFVKQKLHGSFFQLRLFTVIRQFARDSALSGLAEYKELVTLVKYMLRKFFETIRTNKCLCVELLFPKSVKDGYEVVQGYGTFKEKHDTVVWTEEQEHELERLFEAYRNDPVPHGSDLGDVIVKHFSDPSKTRRQVITRLISMDLIASAKQLKQMTLRPERQRRSTAAVNKDLFDWTEHEVERLKSLADLHTGSKTLLTDIMNDLAIDHSLAASEQQQQETAIDRIEHLEGEGNADSAPSQATFTTRSRRAVKAKLLELQLVPDAESLGPVKSGRKRPRPDESFVDADGVVRVAQRGGRSRGGGRGRGGKKRQRRSRRAGSSDDGELRFGSDNEEDNRERWRLNLYSSGDSDSSTTEPETNGDALTALPTTNEAVRPPSPLTTSSSESDFDTPVITRREAVKTVIGDHNDRFEADDQDSDDDDVLPRTQSRANQTSQSRSRRRRLNLSDDDESEAHQDDNLQEERSSLNSFNSDVDDDATDQQTRRKRKRLTIADDDDDGQVDRLRIGQTKMKEASQQSDYSPQRDSVVDIDDTNNHQSVQTDEEPASDHVGGNEKELSKSDLQSASPLITDDGSINNNEETDEVELFANSPVPLVANTMESNSDTEFDNLQPVVREDSDN